MGFHFTMQKVVNTKILKNNTFHQFRHSTTFGVAFHHPSGLTEVVVVVLVVLFLLFFVVVVVEFVVVVVVGGGVLSMRWRSPAVTYV